MKTKNLLQKSMLILSLCVISQVTNAQTTCNGNKVLMTNLGFITPNHKNCNLACKTKCVLPSQVQQYQSQGWTLHPCITCTLWREQGEAIQEKTPRLKIYPMPVSSFSSILFLLEKSENVSIKIFDVNGRLVSTLADKIFEAGENEIVWNAADVNAGVYFLQFQSAENLQKEKIIVTK